MKAEIKQKVYIFQRWWKPGDYPNDRPYPILPEFDSICLICNTPMSQHGRLYKLITEYDVCPGDYIVEDNSFPDGIRVLSEEEFKDIFDVIDDD